MSRERFLERQTAYLERHGTRATSELLRLRTTGTRVQVLVAGSGPPLVMLAGAFFPVASLEPLISAFQDRFTIHAVDRPGCGVSDPYAPTRSTFVDQARMFMADIQEALGLPRVSILASSLGGYYALVHAAERPEAVERLVLLGPPYGIDDHVPLPLKLMSTPGVGRLMLSTVARPTEANVRGIIRSMVAHPERLPTGLEALLSASLSQPAAVASWLCTVRALAGWRGINPKTTLFDVLPRIDVPVCTVWGAHDDVTPPARGEPVMRTLPRGTVEIVEDAAHLVWIDATERCVEIIARFLGVDRPPDAHGGIMGR